LLLTRLPGCGRLVLRWRMRSAREARMQSAKREVRRAREKAVVEFLKAKGLSAQAEYGQVTMSLEAVESLLGLKGN
jgi:hypothetical protein